jgi:hypothetical protein
MPQGSLTRAGDLASLLERLDRLQAGTKPAWGSLDAPRMLCHLGDSFRVSLGEIPSVPRHSFLSRTMGKFVVVHTGFPAPKGKVRTAPEMLTSSPSDWERDLDACKKLAKRVGSGEAHAVHPAFGPMTPEEWAKLGYKHMDHHLRQFGV